MDQRAAVLVPLRKSVPWMDRLLVSRDLGLCYPGLVGMLPGHAPLHLVALKWPALLHVLRKRPILMHTLLRHPLVLAE
jgi:hypothetical protein